jgi:hypothetical protein
MSYNVVKMTESATLGFNLLKNGLPVENYVRQALLVVRLLLSLTSCKLSIYYTLGATALRSMKLTTNVGWLLETEIDPYDGYQGGS